MQPYATRPEPPLSLPIRMDRKRKRTRVGVGGTVIGVGFLSWAGYTFTISGSELIATYLTIVGAGALAMGITQLVRASKSR